MSSKHSVELLEMVLTCDEVFDALQMPPPAPKKRGRPPKLEPPIDLEQALLMQPVVRVAPLKVKSPKKPKLTAAIAAEPPPEMVPPLPRAITFGAQRMVLSSYGACGPLIVIPERRTSFEVINKKIGMQRDARMENWDGLPRFM